MQNKPWHLFLVEYSSQPIQQEDKFQCWQRGQALLTTCVLLVVKHVPGLRGTVQGRALASTKFPWTKYMLWTFNKVAQHFFSSLNLTVKIPLIQCCSTALEKYFLVRKKNKPESAHVFALTVPSPAQRQEIRDTFLNLEALDTLSQSSHLLSALRSCSASVPCGNPFNGMLAFLTYQAAIRSRYAVLPINSEGLSSLVFTTQQKILAHNFLSAVIILPILSPSLKRLLSGCPPDLVPQIVVCLECGHCLNFGRGKFSKVNFLPTHAFYCRDQKEKQFSICASSGRIYCSYCGSASLEVKSMVAHVPGSEELFVRAVLANNAALMIKDLQAVVDVALPCVSGSGCNNCCLKRVSVRALLYLTANSETLLCSRCKGH